MKPLIYIVDDNLVSQFAMQIVLEQSNTPCTVRCFGDGKAPFDAIVCAIAQGESLPDVILLDLNMPKVNGWEFLERIMDIEKTDIKTEIFIISSFTNTQDRNRAEAHPLVEGYFVKPISKAIVDKILLSKIG